MKNSILLVCGLLGTWASIAGAVTTVDFEGFPGTPFTSYTEGRATFSAVDGGLLVKALGPNGTFGITGNTAPYSELRADIAGGTTSVSVELGDYAGIDAETVFLEIFDASGNSLDFVSQAVPANLPCMTTLSLRGPCISYAVFGSRDSTLDNGSSVRADNFTFDVCPCPNVIPAPGAILLGAIGTAIIGHMRRRKTL